MVELTAVRFLNFKGLSDYRVTLRDMNVLVGPNNAGKSSILDAFRLLGPALRHAKRRNPVSMVEDGVAMFGWEVPPSTIPISLMNVHLDSDSDAGVETSVTFFISDGSSMSLILKNSSRCIFKVDVDGQRVGTARSNPRQCRLLWPEPGAGIIFSREAETANWATRSRRV